MSLKQSLLIITSTRTHGGKCYGQQNLFDHCPFAYPRLVAATTDTRCVKLASLRWIVCTILIRRCFQK